MPTLSTESLTEQLVALQSKIRSDASNVKLRIHLFQLLCVMGNWKRALAQLQVCAQMDAKSLPMAQTYREAIRCELFRKDVFDGKRTPQVMGTPPPWMGAMIEALKFDATKDFSRGAELRQTALDAAAATPCDVDKVHCDWFADADSRLGPVLEVIANGQYYWLPFESCRAISLDPPADLRDLVWTAGELMLPNEGRVPVLIPTRYPDLDTSTSIAIDDLKRARLTEWVEPHPDMWFGQGQRLWSSDVTDHPILDTRMIAMSGETAADPNAP